MEASNLTAISPIDGRYADKVEPLRLLFSEYGLIRYRVEIEIRWLMHLADADDINELPAFSDGVRQSLHKMIEQFSIAQAQQVKQIEQTTKHDVKAVEYYLQEQLSQYAELESAIPFLHFACTSEDINNLSYASALRDARLTILTPLLNDVIQALSALAAELAGDAMLSRTHGQPASPTTMGKELANWVHRLQRQAAQFDAIPILGKINGAVGNFNAHTAAYPEVDWIQLADSFVSSLGLECNRYTAQIEPHDFIAEFCDVLTRINTILVDLSRDIWGYVSLGYFQQEPVAGEIGSSTMPHKINPIDFENAEGNLGVANAILQHLSRKLPISRWQRDLTDSTVLRNLGVAMAHTMIAWQSCLQGLAKLELDRATLAANLEQSWEILGEAIQTVMRKNGIADSYEQLKQLTRGKNIDATSIRTFINALEIQVGDKERLLALTPESYTGNAETLAKALGRDEPS